MGLFPDGLWVACPKEADDASVVETADVCHTVTLHENKSVEAVDDALAHLQNDGPGALACMLLQFPRGRQFIDVVKVAQAARKRKTHQVSAWATLASEVVQQSNMWPSPRAEYQQMVSELLACNAFLVEETPTSDTMAVLESATQQKIQEGWTTARAQGAHRLVEALPNLVETSDQTEIQVVGRKPFNHTLNLNPHSSNETTWDRCLVAPPCFAAREHDV